MPPIPEVLDFLAFETAGVRCCDADPNAFKLWTDRCLPKHADHEGIVDGIKVAPLNQIVASIYPYVTAAWMHAPIGARVATSGSPLMASD